MFFFSFLKSLKRLRKNEIRILTQRENRLCILKDPSCFLFNMTSGTASAKSSLFNILKDLDNNPVKVFETLAKRKMEVGLLYVLVGPTKRIKLGTSGRLLERWYRQEEY